MQKPPLLVDHGNLDRINDISFDGTGKRMATCSSDMTVKIWKKIGASKKGISSSAAEEDLMSSVRSGSSSFPDDNESDNGQRRWVNTHKIQAHNGPVWKVAWADPHFGQIIASCSFDRKAIVFEETAAADSTSDSDTVWTQRKIIVDCQASVIDAKFGPQQEGLILALASVDGLVQVYQATSPWNLTVWVQHSKIKQMKNCMLTSISWSTPFTLPTLLAVGANGGTVPDKTERFGLFELVHTSNPNSGKEFAWMRINDPCIEIHAPTSVYEVEFAPSCGRRQHTLAIATNDIRIVKIELPFANQFSYSANESTDSLSGDSRYIFSSQTIVSSSSSTSRASTANICYRLSWNFLGTILAASNGDGSVRLHKMNNFKQWICFSKLGETATESSSALSSRVPFSSRAPQSKNQSQLKSNISNKVVNSIVQQKRSTQFSS